MRSRKAPCPLRAAVAAATAFLSVSAGAAAAQEIPLEMPLPVDDAVRVGDLDNGLTYYVRENARPENRAELRLVVNVGSILEDPDQRGLAHLLEHMAFNGTEHFAEQELVDYLESIGMAFGPSVNAYTSFDETVYMLQVPTDSAEVVHTAFQILEDWAHGLTLDPDEVDQERGVVVEEWRLGRGAAARISDQQLPIMFAGSRYADRLPIGEPEVLESFPQEAIERFYRDWYRPELMAVVAVGDFDADEIAALIRERFSGIEPRPDAPERATYAVPDADTTRYAVASDAEATTSRVAVLTLQEPRTLETLGDYRQILVEGLANTMLNDRLAEIAQRADPPFAFAGTGRGRFVRPKSAYQLVAVVPEDGHERGMEAVLTEAERAARHGFTETELERAKLDLLRARERVFTDRDNQPSARFAGEYLSHFLTGDPAPGIEFEYRAAQALVPGITLDEVNAVARENLAGDNRVVVVDAVDKPSVDVPDEERLAAVFERVADADLEPWVDTALDQPLVAEAPEPGAVVAEGAIEELGVTTWELSNGVTVWLKPTDFKEDEILLRATSPGGWSTSAQDDHLSAILAATLVAQGGVGDFSRIDLQKALAGKAVGVSPSIGQMSEGFTGQASPADVETLFQLVWLYFTEPRRDATAYEAFLSQMRAILANRDAIPQAAFADTLNLTMAQGHPRAAPVTVESLASIDLDTSLTFYEDRFATAEDFAFVLVGAFEVDEMRPLVERWLGGLPGAERDDGWVDLGIDPPSGVVEKEVRAGIEPQSQTVLIFHGPFEYTPADRARIRVMASVLETRLRERLREDLGGTYSVGVNAGYEKHPEAGYTLQVSFGSDPERVGELRAAVFDEIARLQDEGPSPDDVAAALEGERRSLETNLESNAWWASQLTFSLADDADPRFLVDMARYEGIDAAAVQEAARRYLDAEQYVSVVLLPRAGA
ncbi:MAG: insulinase family protein [Longimicrobiales bacterium]